MNPQAFDRARSPEIVQHAQEQLRSILARSAVDLEFRHRLLTDPRAALEEATGVAPPASLRIRFIESEGYATLVLPDVAAASDELAEHDLAAVNGGVAPALAGMAGPDADALVAALAAGALRGPAAGDAPPHR